MLEWVVRNGEIEWLQIETVGGDIAVVVELTEELDIGRCRGAEIVHALVETRMGRGFYKSTCQVIVIENFQ